MKVLILWIIIAVIGLVVYSWCKAAGDADRSMEKLIAEKIKKDEDQWCKDGKCSKCAINDGCYFSEVKNVKEVS